jgi:hypothetical protein
MGFALPQTADRAAPGFPSVRDLLGPQWLLTNQNRPTGSEVVAGLAAWRGAARFVLAKWPVRASHISD